MVAKRKLKGALKVLRRTRLNKSSLRFINNFVKRQLGLYKKDSRRDMPYPTTIMLELTNKCNLHCVTCPREYGYGRKMNLGNMDTVLAKRIIDEAYPYLQSIGLTGMGETLFAPNLLEIAKYIKSKKRSIVIFISTNANIPDFIGRIEPVIPYIDTVQISTDGIDDVYESVRHGAKFAPFKQNLLQLMEIAPGKVDVMLNMVITKLNYRDMPRVVEFAHEAGVRYVNFAYINLVSVTDIDEEYYHFFSTTEFAQVVKETREVMSRCPDVEVTGLDFPGNPGIRKCPLMWNQFQIDFDGGVPPCCAKPFTAEYSFGDVSKMRLIDVLNSDKAKAFRQSWISGRPNDFCRKCHFVKL